MKAGMLGSIEHDTMVPTLFLRFCDSGWTTFAEIKVYLERWEDVLFIAYSFEYDELC